MSLYVAVVALVSRIPIFPLPRIKFLYFNKGMTMDITQLCHDKMYVSWLQKEHLECLPNDLTISTSPGTYRSKNYLIMAQLGYNNYLKVHTSPVFKSLVVFYLQMSKLPHNPCQKAYFVRVVIIFKSAKSTCKSQGQKIHCQSSHQCKIPFVID